LDDSGNVVQYLQGDNVVVNDGEDCAAEAIFGVSGVTCFGSQGSDYFDVIGIGNGTSTDSDGDATNSTLQDSVADDDTMECADASTDGFMAGRTVTPTLTSAASGATGAVVELDTSSQPFTFDASNATVVMDSGIFNTSPGGVAANGACSADATAGSGFSMFSRQLLNGLTGITVSNGDSLSVKWTITVG